jgi:exosortase E/protease (VPEID-CTERM system)
VISSVETDRSPPVSRGRLLRAPSRKGWWIGMAVCLAVEVLVLTVRFDAGAFAKGRAWWARLPEHADLVPRLAVPFAVVLFALGGLPRSSSIRNRRDRAPSLSVGFFLAHLLAFGGFYRITALVMEGGLESAAYPGGVVVLWVLAGGLTLLLLGLAALPAADWLTLARRHLGLVIAAALAAPAAWGAGYFSDRLWWSLAGPTLVVVRGLLSAVCPQVVCDPAAYVIGTPAFRVHILPECSGYEGIGLLAVLMAVYLHGHRRHLRFPNALLLFPVGAAVLWLANAGRIAALILVGSWLSPAAAVDGFHSQAGWLLFNGVTLGLVVASQRLPFFRRDGEQKEMDGEPSATAVYLGPFVALLAAITVTQAFEDGFDKLYPLRVLAVLLVAWRYRAEYVRLRWDWHWPAVVLGAAVFLLWIALPPGTGIRERGHELGERIASLPRAAAAAWLALRLFGAVLVVPFAEELAFRGYLLRRLVARDFQAPAAGRFTPFSFLISSLLFGMLHPSWLAGTLAGMLYALAVYRRGRLGDAVMAHATTNALLAAYVLATGQWHWWV